MKTQSINVLIGIQARSGSQRLPRKVHELIGGKPMIKHVIDAARSSASYLNRYKTSMDRHVKVALLIPEGDDVGRYSKDVLVIPGSESDVLARYATAMQKTASDYIVRITGDCPLLPPYLITKHITCAIANEYDYISNVDEGLRTSIDGNDCEVISKRLMLHLYHHALGEDREHVTTLVRRDPPVWCKMGFVIGHLNLSHMKLSVDTMEDLERVRATYDSVKTIIRKAEARVGRQAIHRF